MAACKTARLYLKEPGWPQGKATPLEFCSIDGLAEVRRLIGSMEDMPPPNTIFYFSLGPGSGGAYIVRDGDAREIWNPHIARRHKISLFAMIAAAPNLSTADLQALGGWW